MTRALLIALALAVGLAACGRKGAPLAPEGAAPIPTPRLIAPDRVDQPSRRSGV